MGKDKQRQSGRDVDMSEDGEKKNRDIKGAKKEKETEKQR